jgi:hypothetical protein
LFQEKVIWNKKNNLKKRKSSNKTLIQNMSTSEECENLGMSSHHLNICRIFEKPTKQVIPFHLRDVHQHLQDAGKAITAKQVAMLEPFRYPVLSAQTISDFFTKEQASTYDIELFMAGLRGLLLLWTRLTACYRGGTYQAIGKETFAQFSEHKTWWLDSKGEIVHDFFNQLADQSAAHYKVFQKLPFSDPRSKQKLDKELRLICDGMTKAAKGKRKKLHRKFMKLLTKSL